MLGSKRRVPEAFTASVSALCSNAGQYLFFCTSNACFTSTKVQILTPARAERSEWQLLNSAAVQGLRLKVY